MNSDWNRLYQWRVWVRKWEKLADAVLHSDEPTFAEDLSRIVTGISQDIARLREEMTEQRRAVMTTQHQLLDSQGLGVEAVDAIGKENADHREVAYGMGVELEKLVNLQTMCRGILPPTRATAHVVELDPARTDP